MHRAARHCIFILAAAFSHCSTWAWEPVWIQQVWRHCQADNNLSVRALLLAQLAVCYQAADEPDQVDSLVLLALNDASLSGNHKIAPTICAWYLDNTRSENEVRTSRCISELMYAGQRYHEPRWLAVAHRGAAQNLLLKNQPTAATREARQSLNQLRDVSDVETGQLVNAYLLMARCQELEGSKLDAFQTLIEVRLLAEKVNDNFSLLRVLDQTADFYAFLGDHQSSKDIRENLIHLASVSGSDSLFIIVAVNDLANSYYRLGDYEAGKAFSDQVLHYALRTGDGTLLSDAFTIRRTNLIESRRIRELKELYTQVYPSELARIQVEEPLLYYRLSALFEENNGNMQRAANWFSKADAIYPADSSAASGRARFHQRYGEFLLRQGKPADALKQVSAAYNDAVISGYGPFIVDAALLLDSLFRLTGDYREAGLYQRLAYERQRLDEQAARKDQVLLLRLKADASADALKKEQEKAATTRRFNLQYTVIAIGIILAFIGVLMARSAHVSPRTLRVISFLSFILLFEFIILIADAFFHFLTHGEPWQMILIKLIFIAGLSQVHHWLEHKLAHYLAQHEPLTEFSRRIKSWWRRDKSHQTSTVPHIHPPVDPSESTNEVL